MCALFFRRPPHLREHKALRWVDGGSHTKQILKDYFSADNEVLFRTVIDVLLYSLGPLAVVAIAIWQSSWFLCSASTPAHTLSLFLTHTQTHFLPYSHTFSSPLSLSLIPLLFCYDAFLPGLHPTSPTDVIYWILRMLLGGEKEILRGCFQFCRCTGQGWQVPLSRNPPC